MATVYLRSRTGRSLLEKGSAAPVDPTPYLPAPETAARAAGELRKRGFTIEGEGATLSISGARELFERECGVTITEAADGSWSASERVMHIADLEEFIEGIVPAVGGALFRE